MISLLAAGVAYILIMEFKNLSLANDEDNQFRFVEAGTLINYVYEVDSYSRIALLTFSESDYDLYKTKADSLFGQIDKLKTHTQNEQQLIQLDSVKTLIEGKNKTIEQLRFLKTTYSQDTSLDDILEEFRKLESSMGKITLENFVNDPSRLSEQERSNYLAYIDFLNSTNDPDNHVSTDIVQSTLEATRYIVAETKKENSRARSQLEQKENELIRTELDLSSQLRKLITAFDAEATKMRFDTERRKEETYQRTLQTLNIAGIIGLIVILFFIYLTLTDFFKAERFKKNLQIAKKYSDSLVKSREQLLSTVSHDLKTPLHTLLGFSQLLENTNLDQQQTHYVTQLHTSAGYASKLVEDLLDYSKLDAGSLTLNNARFCLSDLIEKIAESNHAVYATKEVGLKLDIAEGLKGVWFISDPIRLQQVLNNLISNAFKFTEHGWVGIKVRPSKKEGDLHWIEFKISDTGIGIPEDKIDSIYDEFIQAGTTTHSQYSGSGLGLTITKKLVLLLNGQLTLESTLGKGTTFICELPLSLSSRQKSGDQAPIDTLKVPRKALVFDDDPTMLALLRELLTSIGIESHVFTNYKEVEHQNLEYDFVLTDIQMPEINGFEILERLQDHGELQYKEQPILAMTGNTDYATKYYTDLGFSSVLKKPFPLNILVEALQTFFPRWQVKSEATFHLPDQDLNSSAIYSLRTLETFLDSEDAISEILDVFILETQQNMELLQKAIATLNYDEIQHLAHKMKTMGKQIAAKNVVPLLYEFDSPHVNELAIETLTQMYSKLEIEFQNLFEAINKRQG